MKFADFLAEGRISRSRAARELGRSRSYISDISNNKIRPGRVLAGDIQKWSNGKVTFYDFYPELDPQNGNEAQHG